MQALKMFLYLDLSMTIGAEHKSKMKGNIYLYVGLH